MLFNNFVEILSNEELSKEEKDILSFAQKECINYFNLLFNEQSNLEKQKMILLINESGILYDGYKIKIKDDDIIIESNYARGILHGVYELLRMLGCSFLFPSKKREFIPNLDKWPLKNAEIIREPVLEYRGLCLYDTTAKTKDETLDMIDWMAKNGYNLIMTSIERFDDTGVIGHAILWKEIGDELLPQLQQRGIDIDMSEHSTDFYFSREELFHEHAEWFSEIDGKRQPMQICYSNADAVEAYADSMVEFVKDKPWFKFFGIWPLDGRGYCECDKCEDKLTLFNTNKKIAEKIKEVRPDLIVEHLAYTPQSFARPKELIPNNMCVLVCDKRDDTAYEWAQVAKNSGGAFYFDYHTGDHYRFRSNLWINPRYIKETINAMAGYKYRGMVSLYLPITSWWQSSINYWFMRCWYYHPTKELDELIQELAKELFRTDETDTIIEILKLTIFGLQDEVLWKMMPHKQEWKNGNISKRNKKMDELHQEHFEKIYSTIEEKWHDVIQLDDPFGKRQLTLLRQYIELQKLYYIGVNQYDSNLDTKERAESYFNYLKELEKQDDNPFIHERYARWRITGRDNIFDPNKYNEYQAKAE